MLPRKDSMGLRYPIPAASGRRTGESEAIEGVSEQGPDLYERIAGP